MARGDMNLAVTHAREASRRRRMPYSFGRRSSIAGRRVSRRLLLASGKRADAAAAYELQLEPAG
jgi:hypothetical protein